ncbi:gamma-glutamyltransferase [Candidatus Binatia bacterium]|nr:gamma-glutamyltransferase [Candidatus Binatia bacterium]
MSDRHERSVIATSDPRATTAAAHVLACGGNAVDAAVTAAAVLFVVEPHACGIGGDAFLLVKQPGEAPAALDGSGAVPAALAAEAEQADGGDVPFVGARSITVPGAVSLLETALEQLGTITLADALTPALRLAREGFAVRPMLAAAAARAHGLLASDPLLAALYLPQEAPVRTGDVVRNPQLADALAAIATDGAARFYRGDLAADVARRVAALGGQLSTDDLAAHATLPMSPVCVRFRGVDVWELPAPTQGPAVLVALEALERAGHFDPDAIVAALLAGMRSVDVELGRITSVPSPAPARGGDTTFIAAIDRNGLGVSLITSIFSDFGSGVGVDGLGGPLQNRAATFPLTGRRPRPGKPPHTTIPALVTRDGSLRHALGVVGGYMQAQGQVQVLVNLLVHRMSPEEAVAAPRLRLLHGGELAVEPGHALAARFPDAARRDPGLGGFGGCQIASCADGRISGAADPRRGGLVLIV